jgi:hypothetical protein
MSGGNSERSTFQPQKDLEAAPWRVRRGPSATDTCQVYLGSFLFEKRSSSFRPARYERWVISGTKGDGNLKAST